MSSSLISLFHPILSKSCGSALKTHPEFHCYSPAPLLHSSPTTIISHLVYCVHLLVCISILGPVQPILNTSARVILLKGKSYPITPPLKTLQ